MKRPLYALTDQQQINAGLNPFAARLLAESFADKPEQFGDNNVLIRTTTHNGQTVYLILTKTLSVVTESVRMMEALSIARDAGQIDGAHHKTWVIDQMVRRLTRNDYDKWVADYREGEDGPHTYSWDTGIAP